MTTEPYSEKKLLKQFQKERKDLKKKACKEASQ